MIYRNFSKRQLLAMTWWNRPKLESFDAIICDGAVRSGKTVCMVVGFFLWSMARFDGKVFALCGKTIASLRRNVVIHLQQWLGGVLDVTEHRSDNRLEMELSDLDYTKTYTLQTQAKDLLDEVQSDLTVMPGVPAFHWKKDRFFFHVPVQCDASLSGAYIRSHTLQNADGITLSVEPGQTVFLLGADGLVCGAVGSGGSWWGSQPVTVQSEQGRVRLLFSESCSGEFLLMSARQFSIE